jgi:hypothetical protein
MSLATDGRSVKSLLSIHCQLLIMNCSVVISGLGVLRLDDLDVKWFGYGMI